MSLCCHLNYVWQKVKFFVTTFKSTTFTLVCNNLPLSALRRKQQIILTGLYIRHIFAHNILIKRQKDILLQIIFLQNIVVTFQNIFWQASIEQNCLKTNIFNSHRKNGWKMAFIYLSQYCVQKYLVSIRPKIKDAK